MLLKICYDFVITDEINISSFRHKLVLDQMTTKKVVKVVSFGLSPIGEKYPQTKEKPFVEIIISLTYVREALLIRTCEFLALQGGRGTGKSYKMPKLHLGKVHE